MVPRLSVVVPIYNVEMFLEECLESLAGQTLRELEVIMVNDGSTDRSGEIAAAFAARDPRFRVVEQTNGGLGHARNTGVRNCTPGVDYLTFVDSDDIIPDYAYEHFLSTLDETGSDFASGNVFTLDSKGTAQSAMHRKATATTRLKTHITRDPALIADRLAPNKVFRRTFWDKYEMEFPEGVLYEDTPLTVPAHFRARSVDILGEPTYYWRQREGGAAPSITQRRTELKSVRDRVAAVDSVSRFLAEQPGKEYRKYKRWYDETALASDIRIFINVLPDADQEFRDLFMQVASDFLSRVEPRALDALPALMRLKWHLIRHGKLDELLEVLSYEKKETGASLPVVRRFRRYGKFPFFGNRTVGVPNHVYRLKQELALRTKVSSITWHGDELKIEGFSYVSNLNVHKRRMSLKVIALRNSKSKRTLVIPARTVFRPEATSTSGQNRYSYDWSGFELTVDAQKLKQRGHWNESTWRFAIGNLSRGLLRKGALNPGAFGSGTHPPVHYVDAETRIVPLFIGGRLRLRVEKVRARVTGHELTDGFIEIRGVAAGELAEGSRLSMQHLKTPSSHEYPLEITGSSPKGQTTFTVRIPLDDIVDGRMTEIALSSVKAPDSETWRTEIVVPGEPKSRQLIADDDLAPGRYALAPSASGLPRELALHRNAPGYLLLSDRIVRPVVDRLTWQSDGSLLVEGECPTSATDPANLVLMHRAHHEEKVFPVTVADNRFTATLTVHAVPGMAGTLPLRPGRWNLMFQNSVEGNERTPVVISPALIDELPAETMVAGRKYVAAAHSYDRLALEVTASLRTDEQGPYRQRQLRTQFYPEARTQPLRESVLYDSYTGKQFSDSPRAVFEELMRRGDDLEHLWVVRDEQVELPPGAKAVRMWGREWFEALARSRYIVTNAHLPYWLKRRPGQVVVQAWHGTPLKKIGHDIEDVQFTNGRYLENVAKESKSWSFIVSPNRFSTPILKRAFAFDGELLEAGYPRNDMLYAPERDEIAEKVRERIGLPAGKKVVLYAPTWRDDQYYGPGRYKLDLQVDLVKAKQELGDDFVLLVRRHPNVVDTVPGAGEGFVWDVSEYPEIGELFLAADVLITDYSSLMFDYANTGRPMLFFTYDLAHYRDQLRGFYFDFEKEAPGPLISTSDELIASLKDLDAVTDRYKDAYKKFQDVFCDLDDGQAAGRVIDRMQELAKED
ncbi:bifunctional glycosyltransferase/CDP-glycerol:glycerophosphate glycerophosphotransferase [Streptomyces sp. RKAG293]|uniref:bifunctional glycosyltransferase/CDP-glycerol:glycerophosphate glycerophosphotransferase n=1 Tax=Streptomyces sp. RKAG293 TaxID=2893403 RepID=UPI0025557FE5|nr:bifunctional glycosyltransferase/CDP-glycerol:glycerophosphate glycerophosphotransferase [Streptomyces sp. RKAG293]